MIEISVNKVISHAVLEMFGFLLDGKQGPFSRVEGDSVELQLLFVPEILASSHHCTPYFRRIFLKTFSYFLRRFFLKNNISVKLRCHFER